MFSTYLMSAAVQYYKAAPSPCLIESLFQGNQRVSDASLRNISECDSLGNRKVSMSFHLIFGVLFCESRYVWGSISLVYFGKIEPERCSALPTEDQKREILSISKFCLARR
jgi:hypothetical protein